jgi:hypothetical protein
MTTDPLAELGLDAILAANPATTTPNVVSINPFDGAPNEAPGTDTGLEQQQAKGPKASRSAPVQVQIGEVKIEDGFELEATAIPTRNRVSKYNFDGMSAPVMVDGKWKYSTMLVGLVQGTTKDALMRSVASATVQANKKRKPAKFLVRWAPDSNGARVFRVDQTLAAVGNT